mgnify:CR=1 FL=1
MTDWIIESEATCTTDGSKHKDCTVCNSTVKTQVTPAKGHTEVVDKAVAPTCTEFGLTEGKHCSVCEKILIAQEVVGALGHEYSTAWTFDKEATCTESGIMSHHCIRYDECKSNKDEYEIPAKGHKEGEWEILVEATDTEKGVKIKPCVSCGIPLETEVYDKHVHKYA